MEKLFILAGKARSGKDTTADIIEKYYKGKKTVRLMYAKWLKEYAMIISDWNGSDETKPRTLLQEIGTKSRQINPGYTTRRMQEDINVLKNYFDIIIITDSRMPEELMMPKEAFKEAITMKLVREKFENELSQKEKNNITETALDEFNDYDYIVENNGTIEQLEEKINKILEVI